MTGKALHNDRFRSVTLKQTYGTPQEQKDKLVRKILERFQNPKHWPMTDAERCAFLREIYGNAQTIRATEEAFKIHNP
jgi:hypothetical protein